MHPIKIHCQYDCVWLHIVSKRIYKNKILWLQIFVLFHKRTIWTRYEIMQNVNSQKSGNLHTKPYWLLIPDYGCNVGSQLKQFVNFCSKFSCKNDSVDVLWTRHQPCIIREINHASFQIHYSYLLASKQTHIKWLRESERKLHLFKWSSSAGTTVTFSQSFQKIHILLNMVSIFGISFENGSKWVQTSLCLVQWFLR